METSHQIRPEILGWSSSSSSLLSSSILQEKHGETFYDQVQLGYKLFQIQFGHPVQSAMCYSRPHGSVGQPLRWASRYGGPTAAVGQTAQSATGYTIGGTWFMCPHCLYVRKPVSQPDKRIPRQWEEL
uniref:Uncharacterized protein n=1 Tax=Romanomermis culicivorax TaxID=13658 RepID=A0A915LCE6_ROMCU